MLKLNYKIFGEGEPLIILHGLYGSLDNWMGIARELQNNYKIFLVDVRNHGRSPHSEEHNYDVMADDLLNLMNDEDIYSANLLGHSMGGKIVLSFALLNPERVKRLIVVDISPRTYRAESGDIQINEHQQILKTLNEINIEILQSREEADEKLGKKITNTRVRAFLLKNLYRTNDKLFKWRLNIDVLQANLINILQGFENVYDDFGLLNCPVLFIKGSDSDYIKNNDIELIHTIFKKVTVENIAGASHWVHAEKPDEFIRLVNKFCL